MQVVRKWYKQLAIQAVIPSIPQLHRLAAAGEHITPLELQVDLEAAAKDFQPQQVAQAIHLLHLRHKVTTGVQVMIHNLQIVWAAAAAVVHRRLERTERDQQVATAAEVQPIQLQVPQ